MFNEPRPALRYQGLGASVVDSNPLASSVYGSESIIDPWSSSPSPTMSPAPPTYGSVISAEATVPPIYNKAYTAVDTEHMGDISVNALSRVLMTSSLPASTIDRIINLISNKPRVSRTEFYVALALVALAQEGKDISIEQVAALSSQDTLPEPSLSLDKLQSSASTLTKRPAAPTYSSWDPWNPATANAFDVPESAPSNGPSAITGPGLPHNWWQKLDSVKIRILGRQGFILNQYTVYEIISERGPSVTRRYSEFVFLWGCLTRRYPFRLFPALPPKRVGPDEAFLEQRRRGLVRALNFVINHPVIKEDGLLAVFLTVSSFEEWRKTASISLEEESTTKRVDHLEEMAIPSDLEDKLLSVREKMSQLIDLWQRICILAERAVKRHEAAAVRIRIPHTPFLFRTHNYLVSAPRGDEQSDLSRISTAMRAVTETNSPCWRGEECELSNGVNAGLAHVAAHVQRYADLADLRSRATMDTFIEGLKMQRDLYVAMRDLFVRHDRFSVDQVDRLKKRVETTSLKLEGVRASDKDGWEKEADRLATLIERDQATIVAQLSRRVFIRACMWSELRVVLHNRENTLMTLLLQRFAKEERAFSEGVLVNWTQLSEAIEAMPVE
ncbi:hypothetical protein FISHEDRAFT_57853 [Fistulina hepatica ATCC 64428]|uniref:Sorting nexin MVP1 n=1 Tax=Fistulina hepatica ATCC 64428 TaxID=1128425 RepID=A0A0D7AI09_9AGAR|nr:hypothetical protein FISHEDRAFT_57853 [Fistulina hepatica ATCC 64428]